MACLACKAPMEEWMVHKGYAFHPACGQMDSASGDAESIKLKQFVQHLIRRTDARSVRSQQKRIGPSEIGDMCERRIGYRLLETEEPNSLRDPWPAIVGTAVHAWLDKAVTAWPGNDPKLNHKFGAIHWTPEIRVQVNSMISGVSDVYDHHKFRVIDWKTAGSEAMKKYREQGPPPSYVYQANLYGLGHENAGRQVKDVAIVFLPRAGLLSGIYVWRDLYRRDVAEDALARMEGIGDKLLAGVPVQDLPATPSDNCGYCPWYASGDSIMGGTATPISCPGG